MQLIAYKYRLYPNKFQKLLLLKTFGCTRMLYNQYVAWSNEEYLRWKNNGKIKGKLPKLPLVTEFKKQFPFLKEVDSLALANAKIHYENARKAFLNSLSGKRKGRKVKPPKFKKKGVAKNSYTTNNQGSTVRLTESHNLILPKIKTPIKLNYHRDLIGTIKSCTVSMEKDGSFYASILCQVEQLVVPKRKPNRVIGLDMSLPKFYVSSEKEENNTLHYVKRYRKNEKKLKRLHRRFSKGKSFNSEELYFNYKYGKEMPRQEFSHNKEKARLRLAKQYRKIANQRKNFVCQTASRLTKNYDVIVIEDIDMQSMAKAMHLGKSVNDLGWGMFKQWLERDCEKNGCTLVIADKYFASSKTCSECGWKKTDLRLSDREWKCEHCGAVHDRDFNAALMLKKYYLENINTAGTAEINACEDSSSEVCPCGHNHLESLKQETPQSLVEG